MTDQPQSSTLRTLFNSPMRKPLPPTMETPLFHLTASNAKATVESALHLLGKDLSDVEEIIVAWSHKSPDLDHKDKALGTAKSYSTALKRALPDVKITMAHGFYENKKLDRLHNQGSIYSIINNQTYSYDSKFDSEPIKFFEKDLSNDNKNPDGKDTYFILLDHYIHSGTTLANMADIIGNYGGTVIKAGMDGSIYPPRLLTVRNIAATAICKSNLKSLFSSVAKEEPDFSPIEWENKLEHAMNRHGRSLTSQTAGEVDKFIRTIRDDKMSLSAYINELNNAPPALGHVTNQVASKLSHLSAPPFKP
jgi:hypothetical protein